MRVNKLWLKIALISAVAAVAGIIIATLLIRNSTTADFSSYLQHASRMNQTGQMMGGEDAGEMMGPSETAFLNAVQTSMWIAGGIAVAIAALIALMFSRQITAPLRRLSVAASRVARGDLSPRVTPGSTDEVGSLTNTFNGMVDSLEKNQEMRRKLMGDLAHEMGTPLAVIQSNLEGMLDGVVEPSATNISSLHQESLLLSRLVKDLRTLSQVEAGKLNLSPAPGDIGALVSSIVMATEPEARKKNVSLSMRVQPNLPRAMMDSDRVSQVVVNLLSNALRYTSEGDAIEVAAATEKGSGLPQHLLVSVSDTGQGISDEDLPHVFDRYYQGSQPKGKRSTGSGIGLTVVKELVEAHKGKVWVESAPGKGSTFFFTLPAVSAT